MPLEVQHRSDQFFHRTIEEGCPPEDQGTYIEFRVFPAFRTLLDFLETHLVGREFPDELVLQEVLGTWPTFAVEHGLRHVDECYNPMIFDHKEWVIVTPAQLVVAQVQPT